MVYTLRFFSLKCSLFHNYILFGSCIIHILYTVCAKIKKIIPAPKGYTCFSQTHQLLYKIISWQHVSALLSHHQALHRTDPKFIIYHNAFWDPKCLQ
jgi:hypothetical protein